jgi:curved DNA-binding protein CbpA
MIDYYEFLQISPKADAETIHRVFRFQAARLHPDNPATGDPEMFRILKAAYDVLSDPARRSHYDLTSARGDTEPDPLSSKIDFMDGIDGEINRRLALLTVLYQQRRADPRLPAVSLAEVERRMGFPRDYLDFTTWYLHKKGYIARADNSDFSLTAEGVDYIEAQRANLPVLKKLLTDGQREALKSEAKEAGAQARREPIVTPTAEVRWKDRRSGTRERRSAGSNHREQPERRAPVADRRAKTSDRRANLTDRRTG